MGSGENGRVYYNEHDRFADGLAWFDHVSADLEAEAYAVGAADLAAASVGAPHKRQRLFFVAESVAGGWPWIGRSGQDGAAEHEASEVDSSL